MTEQTETVLRYELEERLRFETLLTEISARYINMPVDRIDATIEDDQRSICECLDLDLSVLWQWTPESPRFMTITHLYSPPHGPSRPEGIDAKEAFPWEIERVLNRETYVIYTEDMPPAAAVDQGSRRFYGIKSSVVIPLTVGNGPVIGILSFDSLQDGYKWSGGMVKRLSLVAQIFSNALARKDADRNLRESEARLNLAADSAEAGIWELDCETNRFWTTERAREIFGYGAGEVIDMERFKQSVLPEDFPIVQQAITRSLEKNKPIRVEYRITVGADRVKWIHSSGRPYFKTNGDPERLLGISMDITERKNMDQKLRESEIILKNSQKDLQRLAGRLISAKEEELKRLSRELHDDLTQRLAVLAIEAGKLEMQMGNIAGPVTDPVRKIGEIKGQLIRVSEDVHRISRQLHPTILDDLGLVRAIESECGTVKQREGLEVDLSVQGALDMIPGSISLCLYRIVQEALHNITSHSGAKDCRIVLQGAEENIFLQVNDEGVGFDPVEVKNMPGLGLSSMRERVLLVGGNFSIDSRPGGGTAIRVEIPLKG